jgi:hypothetical protein
MYKDLNFYIDLKWELFTEQGEKYLERVFQLVNVAYLHHANVFYCYHNIKTFIEQCSDLDTNFNQSIGNIIELIIENATEKSSNAFVFNFQFLQANSFILCETNPIFALPEASGKNAILDVSGHICEKIYLKAKSSDNFSKITFSILAQKEEIVAWIVTQSPKRNFHKSDKHGENGRGNWPGESVLLCNFPDAQNLLNCSIPDLSFSAKQLYNFDIDNKTYIEFYYEGNNPQMQWHGFHITEKEWDKRIPSTIRKYFGY